MIIPLYFIENSWCFLEIIIHNNSYWIDWDIIRDEYGNEIVRESDINLDYINNKNLLCIGNNKYCYYSTKNNLIYEFNNKKSILSVDGTNSLESLANLKISYKEILYELNIIK